MVVQLAEAFGVVAEQLAEAFSVVAVQLAEAFGGWRVACMVFGGEGFWLRVSFDWVTGTYAKWRSVR